MVKNNKGFSLIELMVVVAIIGILASFAIPQYQSFQARARQKEGQSLLSSYYTGIKSAEADTGGIFVNFVTAGFNPTGQLHYRVAGADQAVGLAGAPRNGTPFADNSLCNNTSDACGTAAISFFNGAALGAAPAFTPQWAEVAAGGWVVIAPTGCAVAVNAGAGTFTLCASSQLRAGGAADTWSINNLKNLINTNSGVN